MNRNIYRHELRLRWRSVVGWLLGLAGLHVLFLALFPSFSADAALLNDLMSQFPPEFLTIFGMNGVNLATLMGYYSFVFVFVQLMLAVQAGTYGFGLLSAEEAQRTADFLLTKPVTRSQVWGSKTAAALTLLAWTEIGLGVIAVVGLMAVDEGHSRGAAFLLRLLLGTAPFQWIFLSLGMAASLVVGQVRTPSYYGMGLGFGLYLFNAFNDMLGKSRLALLSPFKYYDPSFLLRQGHWDASLAILGFGITLAALFFSWQRYLHRDIPSVA